MTTLSSRTGGDIKSGNKQKKAVCQSGALFWGGRARRFIYSPICRNLVSDVAKTGIHPSGLVVWTCLDVVVFFDGGIILSSMERAGKQDQKVCNRTVFHSIDIECIMVLGVFWNAVYHWRVDRYCSLVVGDYFDNVSLPADFPTGGNDVVSVSGLGVFCIDSEL